MLHRDDDRKLTEKFRIYKRRNALKALAIAMHKRQIVSLKIEEVDEIIEDDELLESLRVNGLLRGEEVIRFAPHQTVQEHFAALAIQDSIENQIHGVDENNIINMSQTANDAWWAETYIQLAGIIPNPNQLAQKVAEYNPWLAWWCVEEGQTVDDKTQEVIEAQSIALVDSKSDVDRRNAVQALIKLPHARVINQLAKLAIDSEAWVAKPARQALDELGESGRIAFIRIFEECITRFYPPVRTAIGRSLSEWGDKRRGVGVITINGATILDIDWVTIPAGEFQYQDEKQPRHLEAFDIERYPITYAQFQCFIDATDVNDDRWWDGMPNEEKAYGTVYKTREFSEQNNKYLNHPRTNVSWYQAMAFCRWLSNKLGYKVDLPTEQQWERAARGRDGLEYPYGNKFDSTKGNTRETGIGQTSAVGIFPDGASPDGIMDMSGNVWQWCLNKYDPPDHTTVDQSGASRMLRSGAFSRRNYNSRTVSRNSNPPYLRYDSYGFRVCRSQFQSG